MTTLAGGDGHASGRIEPGETLSGNQFLSMLRQVVAFREQAKVAQPLQVIVERIAQGPHFAQSRLLMRILVAVTAGTGSFRRAELSALDAATHALVLALMDARETGTTPGAQWDEAVAAAQAAGATSA